MSKHALTTHSLLGAVPGLMCNWHDWLSPWQRECWPRPVPREQLVGSGRLVSKQIYSQSSTAWPLNRGRNDKEAIRGRGNKEEIVVQPSESARSLAQTNTNLFLVALPAQRSSEELLSVREAGSVKEMIKKELQLSEERESVCMLTAEFRVCVKKIQPNWWCEADSVDFNSQTLKTSLILSSLRTCVFSQMVRRQIHDKDVKT